MGFYINPKRYSEALNAEIWILALQRVQNPTHGSGRFVQILSTVTPFMVVTLKSHQRQLVDSSDPFYKDTQPCWKNPTNGSWWMVQIVSTRVRNRVGKSHQRQWVDSSDPFYKGTQPCWKNPTNGSWWIVQILSTRARNRVGKISPTAVGGVFRSFLQGHATVLEKSHQRQFVDSSDPF